MDAGNIKFLGMRCGHLRDDLIEIHLGCVDDAGSRRRLSKYLLGHERFGIETNGRVMDVVTATERDEVGSSRTGPNEVDDHDRTRARSAATAQVHKSPFR
jgi:hypothetical protein